VVVPWVDDGALGHAEGSSVAVVGPAHHPEEGEPLAGDEVVEGLPLLGGRRARAKHVDEEGALV
jgi:hypothetical protein